MKRYWVTKSGKKILISQMRIDHLENTKKMLKRKANYYLAEEICTAYSFLGTLRGEMAIDCMEGEIWRLENMTPDEWLELYEPHYEAIRYWLDKRKGSDCYVYKKTL